MTERLSKEQFVAECARRREQGLVLRGNTYPIKEEVKEAGGIWDKMEKAWLMPDSQTIERLKSLMDAPTEDTSPATPEELDI